MVLSCFPKISSGADSHRESESSHQRRIRLILGLATIGISLNHLDGHEMVKFMTWAQGILTLQPGVADLFVNAHPLFKAHLFLGMTFPRFPVRTSGACTPIWYLGRRGYQVVRSDGRRTAAATRPLPAE